ncbi:hypothetical protein BVRB_023300 [Beta vulgaris subsp. vulgaris]|uniref:Uncharacterized protein n=1 Tax=Beta vulgaris subsp. vulgaris TaxID=3555 RepID=A0A0J8DTX8_BETVV|nr:hypothetical protein BVRB_023300 [Beta vulgaris subsp. vulgaris]
MQELGLFRQQLTGLGVLDRYCIQVDPDLALLIITPDPELDRYLQDQVTLARVPSPGDAY